MNGMRALKKHWKTTAVLAIVGVVVSFFTTKNHKTPALLFVTDVLFAVSMAFFCWGLLCLVRNMGMFDSLVYGTKCLIRLLRSSGKPSQNTEDGYLDYVRSRPYHGEVPVMMFQAAIFAVLSIIVSIIVR